jgi:hypothetical protein
MVFGMEDLVANAFIGLLENGEGTERKIPVRKLIEYKSNVLESFSKEKSTAVIPTSRDYTAQFLYRFKDYFSYEENDETGDYICLEKEKTLDDLRCKFGAYIANDGVDCFSDKSNLKPILSEDDRWKQ